MRNRRWPRVFFFNDTATTEIYTLSLHDALPIFDAGAFFVLDRGRVADRAEHEHRLRRLRNAQNVSVDQRSEEHTSELQSRLHLVCRLLLEKKKKHPETRSSNMTMHDTDRRDHRT